jgi:hypothetical protein
MASILLPEKVQEIETILVRFIRNIYLTLLPLAVKNARIAATFAAAFLIVVGALGARLGTEFLPKLEEGNLWIRAVMPPTITLEAGMEAVAGVRPGPDGRFRAGPRRRRYRSGRIVPGRVLRAVEAARRVAQGLEQGSIGR